jgi:hypothetical protein
MTSSLLGACMAFGLAGGIAVNNRSSIKNEKRVPIGTRFFISDKID